MDGFEIGRILAGDKKAIEKAVGKWAGQKVDDRRVVDGDDAGFQAKRTTLAAPVSVTGPGTFYGKAKRTLVFRPSSRPGWWIKRTDQDEQLPIEVCPGNVWTATRNIVLRSGSPHNYLRMAEHIIALRQGLGVDDVLIETDNGDPPLFDRSSLDLVEALEGACIVPSSANADATWITVKEPVTIGGGRGDFVTLLPARPGQRKLTMDVAIDWRSVLGQQRIVFDVTRDNFVHGAGARTNATRMQMLLAKTVGVLFADMRHLGYTKKNILIHGRRRYVNAPLPQFDFEGRNYEAVWHRATLDLLAAIALLPGRFAGTAISYRAGHSLDARLMTLLQLHGLLSAV
ncbi:MAG: UDP-3-O-acyl-N-acetylglucosamine deacetylase [Kiritimatiellae bacterium]|nr:UDP-3-O-acyl-N-acetylglucosamine deacetylase [Kiritimatiellia bacterium]